MTLPTYRPRFSGAPLSANSSTLRLICCHTPPAHYHREQDEPAYNITAHPRDFGVWLSWLEQKKGARAIMASGTPPVLLAVMFFPWVSIQAQGHFSALANGCNCIGLRGSLETPRCSPFSPPGQCSIDEPQAMDHVFSHNPLITK